MNINNDNNTLSYQMILKKLSRQRALLARLVSDQSFTVRDPEETAQRRRAKQRMEVRKKPKNHERNVNKKCITQKNGVQLIITVYNSEKWCITKKNQESIGYKHETIRG